MKPEPSSLRGGREEAQPVPSQHWFLHISPTIHLLPTPTSSPTSTSSASSTSPNVPLRLGPVSGLRQPKTVLSWRGHCEPTYGFRATGGGRNLQTKLGSDPGSAPASMCPVPISAPWAQTLIYIRGQAPCLRKCEDGRRRGFSSPAGLASPSGWCGTGPSCSQLCRSPWQLCLRKSQTRRRSRCSL